MDESKKKELKRKLSLEQYEVIVNRGTEAPFTGELLHNNDTGKYSCLSCSAELFDSKTKFDSGTGWPSFTEGINIEYRKDASLGMVRTEILCRKCGAHLGHVFDDGPEGKKRYCVNSCSLDFGKK